MKKVFFLMFVMCLTVFSVNAQSTTGPNDDFDGDGKINSADLDDDNDGILDVFEMQANQRQPKGYPTFDETKSNVTNGDHAVDYDVNTYARFENNQQYLTVKLPKPAAEGVFFTIISQKEYLSDDTQEIDVYESVDGSAFQLKGDLAMANTTSTGKRDYYYVTKTPGVQYIQFKVRGNRGWIYHIRYDPYLTTESYTDIDTDDDGIADRFDLDSDGDGCPDALEGTGNLTNDQINSIGSINGSVNNSGIPLLIGSGQNIGEARDPMLHNACDNFDTDGDSVIQKNDLDDDNDGILDINEMEYIGFYKDVKLGNILSSGYGSTEDEKLLDDNQCTYIDAPLGQSYGRLVTIFIPQGIPEGSKLKVRYQASSGGQAYGLKALRFDETQGNFIEDGILAEVSGTAPDPCGGSSYQGNYITSTHVLTKATKVVKFAGSHVATAGRICDVWLEKKVLIEYQDKDTDQDGIPDRLDLNSDGDGCPDAIEGGDNVTASQLDGNNRIDIANQSGVDANGVPMLVNDGGTADTNNAQGQTVGNSKDGSENDCNCSFIRSNRNVTRQLK